MPETSFASSATAAISASSISTTPIRKAKAASPKALGLAEFFAAVEPICVVLGDNIIENNIVQAVENFKTQKDGAKILLKEVPDAQRFGVAEIQGQRVLASKKNPKIPNQITP